MEIPDEVFHYTKMQTAIEKILVSKKIMFGQVGLTNDPRETKEWSLHAWHDRETKTDYEKRDKKLSTEFLRVRNQEWKVFCASKHTADYSSDSPFLGGDCRPKMWAHYGGNHTGVCLKFNSQKLAQRLEKEVVGKINNSKIEHGHVTYSNQEVQKMGRFPEYSEVTESGIREGIRKFTRDNYKKIFLVKSEDWKDENEYRWLIHIPDIKNSPVYLLIDGILEGLLVGLDFPKRVSLNT